MSDQSFMERFGPRLVANGYPDPADHAGHEEARALPQRRLVATIPTGPGTPSARPPSTSWRSGGAWPEAGVGIVVRARRRGRHRHRWIPSWRSSSSGSPARGSATRRRCGSAARRSGCWSIATAAPFAGIRRAPLEVLGLGQQFVAHAIHPDTGRPYEWPEDSLADLDIEALPAIDEAAARAFLDEALALVPDHLKPARACRRSEPATSASSHAQAGTLAAIREALAWIPNADLDYDSWVRIGLALKGALGDAGGDLFAAWSAQSGKDDAAFTAKTWAGLRAERIGAGTIYHLAMERGWKPDPALVLDGAAPLRRRASGGRAAGQGAGRGSRCPLRPPRSRRSSCACPRASSPRWSTTWSRPPAGRSRCCRSAPASARSAR